MEAKGGAKARYSKPIGRAGIRALDSSLYRGLGFLLTCCDGEGVDCKGAQNGNNLILEL